MEKNKFYPYLPSYARMTSRRLKDTSNIYKNLRKFNEKYIRKCDVETRKKHFIRTKIYKKN